MIALDVFVLLVSVLAHVAVLVVFLALTVAAYLALAAAVFSPLVALMLRLDRARRRTRST